VALHKKKLQTGQGGGSATPLLFSFFNFLF
jgi:hypothetical protein